MPPGSWLVVASLMVKINLFLAAELPLLLTDYQFSTAPLIKMAGTIFLKQKINEFVFFILS